MNEFFRCPRWTSGTTILILWATFFLFIASFIDAMCGISLCTNICSLSIFIGFIMWFFWNIWNIKQDKQCYRGFDGYGGFSYLNIWKKGRNRNEQSNPPPVNPASNPENNPPAYNYPPGTEPSAPLIQTG